MISSTSVIDILAKWSKSDTNFISNKASLIMNGLLKRISIYLSKFETMASSGKTF